MSARADTTGHVAEVFRSWQGEGLLLGRRQVFVRLAGCRVDCRYCDTAWAFELPASVVLPGRASERLDNPLGVEQVLALVEAADPPRPGAAPCPVSLTGGEPLEQPEFTNALLDALASRGVMLETSGLHPQAFAAAAPRAAWVACDLKLPSSTGQADVLERFAAVAATGAFEHPGLFFKLVVDGDSTVDELTRAAALLAAYAPRAPVFLQPVTPLGGSPALPPTRLDALADALIVKALDVRVVPQVHKLLKVR